MSSITQPPDRRPAKPYPPPEHRDFPAFATALWQSDSVVSQLMPPPGPRGKSRHPARQLAIAGLIWRAYYVPWLLLHERSPSAVAFLNRRLRESLQSADLDRLLGPFFSFPQGKTGFDYKKKITKPYLLKAPVRVAAAAALRLVRSQHADAMSEQPGGCPPLLTEFTVEMATVALETLQGLRTASPDPLHPKLHKLDSAIAYLEGAVEDIAAEGGLSNVYHGLQSTGRPNPVGRSHTANAPREARTELYRSTGYWDYDWRSCHIAAFLGLAQQYGHPMPLLTEYQEEKAELHDTWARKTGHSTPDDFKGLVLGFLNAGTLDVSLKSAIWKTLCHPTPDYSGMIAEDGSKIPGSIPTWHTDRTVADAWVALKDVQCLHAEVAAACKVIVAHHSQMGYQVEQYSVDDGALTPDLLRCREKSGNPIVFRLVWNAVDQVVAVKTPSQVLAHLLHGYEQFAMQYVWSRLPEGSVVSAVHDGWVSRTKLSDALVQSLEQGLQFHSAEQIGFPLSLSLKAEQFTPLNPAEDF